MAFIQAGHKNVWSRKETKKALTKGRVKSPNSTECFSTKTAQRGRAAGWSRLCYPTRAVGKHCAVVQGCDYEIRNSLVHTRFCCSWMPVFSAELPRFSQSFPYIPDVYDDLRILKSEVLSGILHIICHGLNVCVPLKAA